MYTAAVIVRLLIPRVVLGLLLVTVLLVAGQLGQLAPVLRQAGAVEWSAVLGAAFGVLIEPALPLVCLFAAGATYGALRSDGAWTAALALGHRPLALLRPAIALGLIAAVSAATLAHGPVPRWIDGLRGDLLVGLAQLPTDAQLTLATGHARIGPDRSLHAVTDRTYLRARRAHLQRGADGWRLIADDAWIWSPGARVRIGRAELVLDRRQLERRLGQLGAPNSLPTAALDRSAHHRFVAHRRSALPMLGIGWAILGAVLGVRLGARLAVLVAAGLVGASYWILRVGELNARADFAPPWFAAWAPVMLVALLAALGLARLRRSG